MNDFLIEIDFPHTKVNLAKEMPVDIQIQQQTKDGLSKSSENKRYWPDGITIQSLVSFYPGLSNYF